MSGAVHFVANQPLMRRGWLLMLCALIAPAAAGAAPPVYVHLRWLDTKFPLPLDLRAGWILLAWVLLVATAGVLTAAA